MTLLSTFQNIGLPSAILSNTALSILLPVALGAAVGYSQKPTDTQKTYAALKQPPLRPPGWVFGPVWTTLYGLMGYSIHRLSTLPSAAIHPSLTSTTSALYTLQLALNLAWMPLFFGISNPALALADILALDAAVLALTVNAFQLDASGVSGWLLVPYCCWLGFATYINVGVGVLNGWSLENTVHHKTK